MRQAFAWVLLGVVVCAAVSVNAECVPYADYAFWTGSTAILGTVNAAAAAGQWVYLATTSGFHVFDVSDADHPVRRASMNFSAGASLLSMAGSTAYPVNGDVYPRNTPNFVIMGQSYERHLSEALENFGHRVEWLMAFHVFRSSSNETLPYNPCYWPDFPSNCGSRHPTPQRLWDRPPRR